MAAKRMREDEDYDDDRTPTSIRGFKCDASELLVSV